MSEISDDDARTSSEKAAARIVWTLLADISEERQIIVRKAIEAAMENYAEFMVEISTDYECLC